ncbi:MAG: hypothetical protein ACO1RX_07555 [Candidatus Sericytochromatia bacterium]
MDIRSFTPQTQRTLARMDTNRDNQLSVRELGSLKNVPSVPGIAPKDLAVIQASLTQTTGPSQIIVPLVDDQPLAPGVSAPAPLFRERPAARPAATSPAAQTPAAQAAPAAADKKRPARAAEAPPLSLRATPRPSTDKAAAAAGTSTGMDVQATGRVGDLQIQSSSSFGEAGEHTQSKLNATYQPVSGLSVRVGVSTPNASSTASSKGSSSGSARTSGSAKKAPTSSTAPAGAPLNLDSQVQAGPLKLSAKGKLDTDSSQLRDLSTGAELQVLSGHSLRAEVKPPLGQGMSWSAVELGSAHKLWSGLDVTTRTRLGEGTKPSTYGAGLRYDAGNGLNLEAEASTRSDTRFSAPLDTVQSMDFRVGARFKTSF